MRLVKIKISNLRLRHFRLTLAIVLVAFSISGILLFWQVAGRAEKATVERVKAQELTLARSGALAVSELFRERKANLLLLAEVEAIKAKREKEGRQAIRDLVDRLEGQILASIVRVDKEGKSLWSDNPQHQKVREGVDLADRDYFLWAKEQKESGEVFVSQPVISRGGMREGEWIVVMAAPVFYQERFDGLVFISFSLEDLTEKYVIPLAFSPKVQSLIIGKDGIVVASTVPEVRGQNLLGRIQIEEGKEGSLVHFSPFNEEERVISAYAPIKIGEQVWSLWIFVPYEEAMRFISPFRLNQIGGIVFVAVLILTLILVFIFGVRIAHKDAFLDGYARAKDDFDKKKKK